MRATNQPLTAESDISSHATVRMQQRRISAAEIDLAVQYGRLYRARDAEIFVVGKQEIRKYDWVPEMTAALDGLHVVCSPTTGAVITVYRNRGFKRSSFDSRRHGQRTHGHD